MLTALCLLVSVPYGSLRALRKAALLLLVAATPAFAEPVRIIAFGDSLTQGFGLPEADGFVPQLQAWLVAKGEDVVLVNAGVSGDTTAGGAARISWTLAEPADALIVALGGNDVLRGLGPDEARANLSKILAEAQAKSVPVLLVGIEAPSNYGPDYKAEFEAIYPELAREYDTLLAPSFLNALTRLPDRPATLATFMQADMTHPNAEGVALIIEDLGPQVMELLARVQGPG